MALLASSAADSALADALFALFSALLAATLARPASMTASCAAAPATLAACNARSLVPMAVLAVESSVAGELTFPVTVARPPLTDMVTTSPGFADATALTQGVSLPEPTKQAQIAPEPSTLVTVPRVSAWPAPAGKSPPMAADSAFDSACPITFMPASPTSRTRRCRLRTRWTATSR